MKIVATVRVGSDVWRVQSARWLFVVPAWHIAHGSVITRRNRFMHFWFTRRGAELALFRRYIGKTS